MTLVGKSKVYKHAKAATLYLSVPSSMAVDSAFPFKAGDRVLLECLDGKTLVITKDGFHCCSDKTIEILDGVFQVRKEIEGSQDRGV